jgi:hypothetical protein
MAKNPLEIEPITLHHFGLRWSLGITFMLLLIDDNGNITAYHGNKDEIISILEDSYPEYSGQQEEGATFLEWVWRISDEGNFSFKIYQI